MRVASLRKLGPLLALMSLCATGLTGCPEKGGAPADKTGVEPERAEPDDEAKDHEAKKPAAATPSAPADDKKPDEGKDDGKDEGDKGGW